MRKCIIFAIAFVSVICLSFIGSARCDGTTALSINPPLTTLSQSPVGTNFTVSINITDVTDLWGWKVQLSWDPTVLNLTSGPTEGSFMGGGTLFLASPTNYSAGFIHEISDTYLSNTNVNGSGVLATVTFKVLAASPSNIVLNETELLGPYPTHTPIAHTVYNGQFVTVPEFSSGTILAAIFAATTLSAAIMIRKRTKLLPSQD